MAIVSNLGFPRIGARRELKKALEDYWTGKVDESGLLAVGATLRQKHWTLQKQIGLEHIPSNDFSLYDHVLDAAAMVGAVPSRFDASAGQVDLRTYFAMARGLQEKRPLGTTTRSLDVPAMEMTKWFDTNYHYIVPEFESGQEFRLASTKPVDEFLEAKALGIQTRPVLLGPVSFLLLGKPKDPQLQPLSLLSRLLSVYSDILQRLENAGGDWVQMDEPCLILDLPPGAREAFISAYTQLSRTTKLRLLVATYFEGLRDNLSTALALPVSALHVDLVRAPYQLDSLLQKAPSSLMFSVGVIDGRNVWKSDFETALALAEKAVDKLGSDRIIIAPSCSLLHSPVDLELESDLHGDLKEWLAFARQKLEEVVLISRAINEGRGSVREGLAANKRSMAQRRTASLIHDPVVKSRVARVTPEMLRRKSEYPVRREAQRNKLDLPLFPTTTIGSFPQTPEIRVARSEYKTGKRTQGDYEAFLKKEIERTIRFQEQIGIDVLVHGEFERNDMVEFFGEQLSGFAATDNGWIQSYGSRCVKPPIIYGDVARREAMTVKWSSFAQSLTKKPMKGMLTGPVTILQWSLVRDDQPRAETCRQIALAIRDEVKDLERAGISVVQIDEPAVREGLPLRKSDWKSYLDWAVAAFRLASSGAADTTQIHTHMCYSEFHDIIEAVGEMDADVISIETSRSHMELLSVFARYHYPA